MAQAKLGNELTSGGLSELKQRLLFLFIGLVVFRIGAYIPVPGLDPTRLAALFKSHSGGLLGIFNMFSGGALNRMTIFALSIMPYISASIIVQMFGSISPKLIQLKKEGESGRRTMNQYTRYGTLFLALIQGFFITKWLVSQHIALYPNISFYFVSVITLVTGTMFLMWLGEQMTERGVGNGISMIILAGIVAKFPSAVAQVITPGSAGADATHHLDYYFYCGHYGYSCGCFFRESAKTDQNKLCKKTAGKEIISGSKQPFTFKNQHVRCDTAYLCSKHYIISGNHCQFYWLR